MTTPEIQSPQPAPAALTEEALTDLIAENMSAVYHCTRVWEAWHVGTMSQDDFEPYADSDSPRELAAVILAAMAASPAPAPAHKGAADQKSWCLYVAGMVGAYLGFGVDDNRIPAMASVIENRLWALAHPAQAPAPTSLAQALGAGVERAARDLASAAGWSESDARKVLDHAPAPQSPAVGADQVTVEQIEEWISDWSLGSWGGRLGEIHRIVLAAINADRKRQERTPLAVETIRDAIDGAGLDWHNGWTVGDEAANRYLNLCRAIERAHGIGESKPPVQHKEGA